MPIVNAASYTHRLNYNHDDNSSEAELYADITFNDNDPSAQQNTTGSSTSIDSGFTTSINFYYTPIPGGSTYSIGSATITEYRLTLNNPGSTEYDGDPTLFSQLSNIQFGTFGATGAFSLTMNADSNELQARRPGGTQDDFILASTSTSSFPAPLPILGLLPAFSSIRNLKKRYKSIYN